MKRNLLTSMFVIGAFTGVFAQSIEFTNQNEPVIGDEIQTFKLDVTNFSAYTQVNTQGTLWDYSAATITTDVGGIRAADPATHSNAADFPGTNVYVHTGPVSNFLKTTATERVSFGVYYDDLVGGNPLAVKYNAPGQKLMTYPFSAGQNQGNTFSGSLSFQGFPVNFTGTGTVKHDGVGAIKIAGGIISDVTRVVYKDVATGTTILGAVKLERVTIEYYKNGQGKLPIFIESNVKMYLGTDPNPAQESSSAEIHKDYTNYLSAKEVALFDLKIAPNPTSGTVTINGDFETGKVTVLDVQGKEVLSQEINAGEQLNLKQGAGVYFVTITTDKGTQTQKVVVK